MRKFLCLALAAAGLQAAPLNALTWDRWYKLRECDMSLNPRVSCDKCKATEVEIKFFTDKKSGSVISKTRSDKIESPPEKKSNCTILNDESWNCESSSKFEYSREGMGGGVYTRSDFIIVNNQLVHSDHYCAKR
jgi:hypothetical protein